jgi:hypothetical protein
MPSIELALLGYQRLIQASTSSSVERLTTKPFRPLKTKKESPSLTIHDLEAGRRTRITEGECEQLTGRSKWSLQKDRSAGKGIPFTKDTNGRIWYEAADVLGYLKNPKYRGTFNYDTSAYLDRMERAREAKRA